MANVFGKSMKAVPLSTYILILSKSSIVAMLVNSVNKFLIFKIILQLRPVYCLDYLRQYQKYRDESLDSWQDPFCSISCGSEQHLQFFRMMGFDPGLISTG